MSVNTHLFSFGIMSWFFCYFVEERYGYVYREPAPWFNVQFIADNCPDAVFHTSETHHLHRLGSYLKNFGLRTAMIIEVKTESDACILKMLDDQVVNENTGSKNRPPTLQLIFQNPDFTELRKLCEPLEEYKKNDAKRRGDLKATTILQKQIDRVMLTVDDLEGSLSPDFLEQAGMFVDSSYQEIDRIRNENRSASRKATVARKALAKKLMTFSIYAKTSL